MPDEIPDYRGLTPAQKRREIARIESQLETMWDEEDGSSVPRRNGARLSNQAGSLPLDTCPVAMEEGLDVVLAQAVARWKGDLPATLAEFRVVVTAIALEAIKEAASEGVLAEMIEDADQPITARTREVMARLVADFMFSQDPQRRAKCYDFVFGLCIQPGITQTKIAEEEGLERATISKECTELKELYGVRPARGMKTDEACEVYRNRELQKPKRPKTPWRFASLIKGVINGSN